MVVPPSLKAYYIICLPLWWFLDSPDKNRENICKLKVGVKCEHVWLKCTTLFDYWSALLSCLIYDMPPPKLDLTSSGKPFQYLIFLFLWFDYLVSWLCFPLALATLMCVGDCGPLMHCEIHVHQRADVADVLLLTLQIVGEEIVQTCWITKLLQWRGCGEGVCWGVQSVRPIIVLQLIW